MVEQTESPQSASPPEVEIEPLRVKSLIVEIFYGIGIALGLIVLWLMEIVRNVVFNLLDRANFRPRVRRASAFPPGQPRKRAPLDAHR